VPRSAESAFSFDVYGTGLFLYFFGLEPSEPTELTASALTRLPPEITALLPAREFLT